MANEEDELYLGIENATKKANRNAPSAASGIGKRFICGQ